MSDSEGLRDITINRRRQPVPIFGYDADYPIPVSGEYGVINYLRSLSVRDAVPDSRGHWSARDLVYSVTQIPVPVDKTQSSRPLGPTICACRIESRLGLDDLFFHIVDGAVEKAEALDGWQLTRSACNPRLDWYRVSDDECSGDDVKINPCRPQLGYNTLYPISVSGECGIVNYLRCLAIEDAAPDGGGRWSAQDIVLSATRMALLSETTPGFRTVGGMLCACRINSRFEQDDLFFEVVDGAVEPPEAPNGWQLTPSACNPKLELLDHPRFCERGEDFELVEDSYRVERIRWKDEVSQPPATRPLIHNASPISPESRVDAPYSYTLTSKPLTNEERARRADIQPKARRLANIGGREIELIAGAILWDGAHVPLDAVGGLCWQTRRSERLGWIRLRVEGKVFEARWDVAGQPSAQSAAQQLVGMLLLELRSPIVEAIAQRLAGGGHEHLGDAVLTKEGVQLKAQGLWRNKDFLCPWRDVETEIDGATVSISCVNRRVATVRVGLDVENAFALHFLPSRMFSL